MQIYKQLPRTNCKECGFPTCMAFAMQVAAKQKAIIECPFISDEAVTSLSEESSPPMKLVKIGTGDRVFETGKETVLFRHEEKFHHPCGLAVCLGADLPLEELRRRAEEIGRIRFLRVGRELKPELCALEIDGAEGCGSPAERAKAAAEAGGLPLILIGEDPAAMAEAAGAVRETRPLLYRATSANIDSFIKIAADHKLPLAVSADSEEELADCTVRAKEAGVEEMLLSWKGGSIPDAVRFATRVRRAALLKKFRPFGYPVISEFTGGSAEEETIRTAAAAAKYSGIVILRSGAPWQLIPNLTIIQDIYTDPQVPNAVESRLYEIGNPDENSPVMFTTNFSLTYYSVAGEVERSKIPSFICVVDTEGLGVLNSYAGDKISARKVIQTLKDQKVAERVSHRKLIIPGLLPVFKAEIEEDSEWKEVIIGTESSRDIPAFMNRIWGK